MCMRVEGGMRGTRGVPNSQSSAAHSGSGFGSDREPTETSGSALPGFGAWQFGFGCSGVGSSCYTPPFFEGTVPGDRLGFPEEFLRVTVFAAGPGLRIRQVGIKSGPIISSSFSQVSCSGPYPVQRTRKCLTIFPRNLDGFSPQWLQPRRWEVHLGRIPIREVQWVYHCLCMV